MSNERFLALDNAIECYEQIKNGINEYEDEIFSDYNNIISGQHEQEYYYCSTMWNLFALLNKIFHIHLNLLEQ